jgi:hypothetical protein
MIFIFDYKQNYGGGLLFINQPNRAKAQKEVYTQYKWKGGEYIYKCTMREFIAMIKKDGNYDDTWEE